LADGAGDRGLGSRRGLRRGPPATGLGRGRVLDDARRALACPVRRLGRRWPRGALRRLGELRPEHGLELLGDLAPRFARRPARRGRALAVRSILARRPIVAAVGRLLPPTAAATPVTDVRIAVDAAAARGACVALARA